MASMRRAVRMSWHSFCVEVRHDRRKGTSLPLANGRCPRGAGAQGAGARGRGARGGRGRGAGVGLGRRRLGGGWPASPWPWSADPQLSVADPGQAAFGAPALGAVDELDDLAVLGAGDGVQAGHGVPDVAFLAGPGDEPHQVGLGREPLAVTGGVAEQEPGQLRLRVERPVLGETVIEDENVIHVDRPFCTVCGSLRHLPANRHEAADHPAAGAHRGCGYRGHPMRRPATLPVGGPRTAGRGCGLSGYLSGYLPAYLTVDRNASVRVPWATSRAGPVMRTVPPGVQSSSRRPPRSSIVIGWPVRSRTWAATATAQAPVPQARVSPTPRSQVRWRTVPRSTTWANSTLVLAGRKAGWVSSLGPRVVTGALSTSSTNTTAWGLPMDRVVAATDSPSTSRVRSSPSVGAPMSTVTRSMQPLSSAWSSRCLTPARVSRSKAPATRPRSPRYLPTTLTPLPHISAREPSALR